MITEQKATPGKLTAKLEESFPDTIKKLDETLENVREITATLNSKKSRKRIEDLIANLKVTSDNLKIVSTHAKLFTGTVAQRPWRLVFGGKENKLPDEDEILSKDRPLKVKPAEGVR